jgi:O-antigen ligase
MNQTLPEQQLVGHPETMNTDRAIDVAKPKLLFTLLFLLLHIPLALAMTTIPLVGTLHIFIAFFLGLAEAGFGKRMDRVARIAAYIVAAEVLWRMTYVHFFWEFAKYATALILLIAWLRRGELKSARLPLVFFLLLLPSVALTVHAYPNLGVVRRLLSFTLSGPFLLTICTIFFSRFGLKREQMYHVVLTMIAPLIGVVSIALFNTMTASSIKFGSESVSQTSGGFLPNQVASVLGLGALLCFLSLVQGDKKKWSLQVFVFGTMFIFAIQTALTFSRGGLYMASGSAVVASVFLLRARGMRLVLVFVIASLLALTSYVVFPRLEAFTGGRLSTRFKNLDTTGRDKILLFELKIWSEHPVLGVGPGGANRLRRAFFGHAVAAHTEFSRLLAEHGTLGAAALIALLIMAKKSLSRARTHTDKAFVVAMITWSLLFMSVNGMRLAAPGFCFGFAFAPISKDEDESSHSPQAEDISYSNS